MGVWIFIPGIYTDTAIVDGVYLWVWGEACQIEHERAQDRC